MVSKRLITKAIEAVQANGHDVKAVRLCDDGDVLILTETMDLEVPTGNSLADEFEAFKRANGYD